MAVKNNCFDEIIAVRNNCANTVPTSGFYIDELGIDLDLLNDFATHPYANGEDLFNKKLEFARALMVNNINTQFADRYRTASAVSGDRIGYIQENLTERPASAQIQGIEIEMCNNRAYLDFYLTELELLLNYTGDLTLNVYDLLQGRIIDTIEVTGIVAGEKKTVYVNRTYKSSRQKLHLFIAYDATTVAAYDVTLGQAACTTCGSSGYIQENEFVRIGSQYMDVGATAVDSSLNGLGHTGGLSIIYGLTCNHESWMCEQSNLLALPLLYKTGVEILEHALVNWNHINSAVLVQRDNIEQRRDQLQQMYVDKVDNVMKVLRVPMDNICFRCNPKSVTRTILP